MANIKEIIKKEYIKCAKDPVYFMKKYCWIQHPTRGRIQFNLFPFQEGTLNLLQKHDRTIILKSRQLGISTLSAGLSLWMMLFQKDKAILVVATKQDTAKNGTGNFFHKMWTKAEEGINGFVPIRLPWTVHPERDQAWRDKQDDELGIRMAAQECDCDFTTSGNTVYDIDLMKYYEQTFVCEPVEKRGIEGNLHRRS